jgi:hypothetical protein
MTTPIPVIKNVEIIERIFGCWPSFHDAEVHRLAITRGGGDGPEMDITIHHWEMTNEVDARGYYTLRHHTLTTLRFSGVQTLQLDGFHYQNVLFELEISECEPGAPCRYFVGMPGSTGFDASFGCNEIHVLSAEPYQN